MDFSVGEIVLAVGCTWPQESLESEVHSDRCWRNRRNNRVPSPGNRGRARPPTSRCCTDRHIDWVTTDLPTDTAEAKPPRSSSVPANGVRQYWTAARSLAVEV